MARQEVEALDYTGEFELVISGKGSADGVREHLTTTPTPWTYVGSTVSTVRGTAHARNAGIAAARGDFLAFTDQGDAVYPNSLTEVTRKVAQSDAFGGAVELETLNSRDVSGWLPKRFSHYRSGNGLSAPEACMAAHRCALDMPFAIRLRR